MFSSYDFSIFRRERENPPTQPNPKGHVSSSLWFLREKLDFVVPSNQQNFHWFVCHTDSRLYMSVRLDRLVGWLDVTIIWSLKPIITLLFRIIQNPCHQFSCLFQHPLIKFPLKIILLVSKENLVCFSRKICIIKH